jgi:hypothetical protein
MPHDHTLTTRLKVYRARHRRNIPWWYVFEGSIQDMPSRARCMNHGAGTCATWFCPRHNPETYADCMARHATDSFPVKGWSRS